MVLDGVDATVKRVSKNQSVTTTAHDALPSALNANVDGQLRTVDGASGVLRVRAGGQCGDAQRCKLCRLVSGTRRRRPAAVGTSSSLARSLRGAPSTSGLVLLTLALHA